MRLFIATVWIAASIVGLIAFLACQHCPFHFRVFVAAINLAPVLLAAAGAFSVLGPWVTSGHLRPGNVVGVVLILVSILLYVVLLRALHPMMEL